MANDTEAVLEEVAVEEETWLAEIDSSEQGAAIASQIEELVQRNKHLVVIVSAAGTGKSAVLVDALRHLVSHGKQRQSLIDLLTPAVDVPRPAAVLQARRNSEARRELLEEFGALTSAEVADHAGSSAANRSALATRWRKEGRSFAVTLHDTLYYPGFQFDENGRPLPVIGQILDTLGASEMGDWEVALWFRKRGGWLGDRRPVDLLTDDPAAVLEAARRERHELVA